MLADDKIERFVRQILATRKSPLPSQFYYFVFRIPAETIIPQGLHITRDNAWPKSDPAPTGHHSVNALHQFATGEEYVEKLFELNGMGVLIADIKYTITVENLEPVEAIIRRRNIALTAEGVDLEKEQKKIKRFKILV